MAYLHSDVRTLTRGALEANGVVPDIIVGSPPCPEFSCANPRAGGLAARSGQLFIEAVRLVRECRPDWGIFENTPAIRLRGLDWICETLEREGYACWPTIIGADCAGAPHIRERLWLVFADPARQSLGHGGQPRQAASSIADPARAARQQDARGAFGHEGADEGRTAQHDHRFGSVVAGANGHAIGAGRERAPAQRAVRADDDAMRERCLDTSGQGPVDPTSAVRVESFAPSWATSLPDLALVDDGPAAELARSGALYRAICAAQGDAIVPQVAYQIVRAMMPMFPEATRVLDLFAGAVGGWAYACRWAGLDVVAACEIDPWRREVYAAVHHPQT